MIYFILDVYDVLDTNYPCIINYFTKNVIFLTFLKQNMIVFTIFPMKYISQSHDVYDNLKVFRKNKIKKFRKKNK